MSQYLTGKFYYYIVAYLPAFVASCMAILIEKPSRRSSLAFYVSNVASDALYRIYVEKRVIRPIPHGLMYLFSASIASILYLARKSGFEKDALSLMIGTIVGKEEARQKPSNLSIRELKADDEEKRLASANVSSKQSAQQTLAQHLLNKAASFMFDRHNLCPHQASCLRYVIKSAMRALLYGYCGQLGLRLVTRLPQFVVQCRQNNALAAIAGFKQDLLITQLPAWLLAQSTESGILKFGLFLCSFTCLFKGSSCVLRHCCNSSSATNTLIAGLIAGPTFALYPSPTLALYVVWKSLEINFHNAARQSQTLAKHKDALIVLLYGLSTSQLFYSALLNPKHIKKSYMAFLDKMSRHRLHWINRNLLDVFGTQASLGYEDFFPDLHPKFLSKQFLSSIWIWMLEQRFVADQLYW